MSGGLDRLKIQAARLKLVSDRPYYASVVFRCPLVASTDVPTMAVDRFWRIYLNPAAVDSMSVSRLAAAFAHEANHLLRGHAERADQAGVRSAHEHRTWNFAADAELNDDLKRDGLDVSPSWIFPSTIGQPDDLTAEEYYSAMPPQWTVGDPSCGPGSGGWTVSEEFVASMPPLTDPDAVAVTYPEDDLLRRRTAGSVIEFARRGYVPGALRAWATELLEPTVDWRRQLGSLIRTATVRPGTQDYDYRRFSRRNGAGHSVRWPGMIQTVARVAVVVDTSGSMSDEDVTQALSEVQGLIRSASVADESVRVLTVDAEVSQDQRTRDVRTIGQLSRGGTDMRVGIDQAVRGRPRPDVVIVLTDGYTPWPDAPTPGVVFIAGLVNSGYAAHRVPDWMRTVRIDVHSSA